MLPKYFSSEWSVAQFRLQEGLQHVVAFGHQKNTIVILGMDGRYGISVMDHICDFLVCIFQVLLRDMKHIQIGAVMDLICVLLEI